jgi:hypothetical protein
MRLQLDGQPWEERMPEMHVAPFDVQSLGRPLERVHGRACSAGGCTHCGDVGGICHWQMVPLFSEGK